MRYPTREYQSDSSSLPLGRSADWIPTACAPGWLHKPGAHSGCYRTKKKDQTVSLDNGLSISVVGRPLNGVDHQHFDRTPTTFKLQTETSDGGTRIASSREEGCTRWVRGHLEERRILRIVAPLELFAYSSLTVSKHE